VDQRVGKILAVLQENQLAVIATVDRGCSTPESALIAYVQDDALNLYFQTGLRTRKAANLRHNPHVSLVVGLDLQERLTLQYQGVARQLADEQEIAECKQRFLDKNSPTTPGYFDYSDTILFKVTPTWIGCSDYSGERPFVVEYFAE